jgi:hypothetical protein
MKFTLHHPRLLVSILLLLGIMTTSALLLADGGDEVVPTRFIPFPVAEPAAPLTEEQKQAMARTVKESGVVEFISGAQEWTFDVIGTPKINGHESASMIVSWENPVDNSGPWTLVKCDGALRMVSSRGFTGITQLMVHVDREDNAVLAYSVTGESGEDPVIQPREPDATMKFYDFKTGEIVFDGKPGEVARLDKVCPDGWQPRFN